jgi:hypothetical protein
MCAQPRCRTHRALHVHAQRRRIYCGVSCGGCPCSSRREAGLHVQSHSAASTRYTIRGGSSVNDGPPTILLIGAYAHLHDACKLCRIKVLEAPACMALITNRSSACMHVRKIIEVSAISGLANCIVLFFAELP